MNISIDATVRADIATVWQAWIVDALGDAMEDEIGDDLLRLGRDVESRRAWAQAAALTDKQRERAWLLARVEGVPPCSRVFESGSQGLLSTRAGRLWHSHGFVCNAFFPPDLT